MRGREREGERGGKEGEMEAEWVRKQMLDSKLCSYLVLIDILRQTVSKMDTTQQTASRILCGKLDLLFPWRLRRLVCGHVMCMSISCDMHVDIMTL